MKGFLKALKVLTPLIVGLCIAGLSYLAYDRVYVYVSWEYGYKSYVEELVIPLKKRVFELENMLKEKDAGSTGISQ